MFKKFSWLNYKSIAIGIVTLFLAPLLVNYFTNLFGPDPDPYIERRLKIKERVQAIRIAIDKSFIEASGISETIKINMDAFYEALIQDNVDENFLIDNTSTIKSGIAMQEVPMFEAPDINSKQIDSFATKFDCPENSVTLLTIFFVSKKQDDFENKLKNLSENEFIDDKDKNFLTVINSRLDLLTEKTAFLFGDKLEEETIKRYSDGDMLKKDLVLFGNESPAWMYNFAIDKLNVPGDQ